MRLKDITQLCRMESSPEKPRRGRPPKYSPEEKLQAYKEKHKLTQHAHYARHREETCNRTKQQGQLYRFAYKLLQDIWNDQEIKSDKYNPIIKSLLEQKQIVEY